MRWPWGGCAVDYVVTWPGVMLCFRTVRVDWRVSDWMWVMSYHVCVPGLCHAVPSCPCAREWVECRRKLVVSSQSVIEDNLDDSQADGMPVLYVGSSEHCQKLGWIFVETGSFKVYCWWMINNYVSSHTYFIYFIWIMSSKCAQSISDEYFSLLPVIYFNSVLIVCQSQIQWNINNFEVVAPVC